MERRPLRISSEMTREVPVVRTKKEFDGNIDMMISTGSTLLDLAISGGRKRGGGLPAGIFVEIFGPSSSGKTVLLCEIAGAVQRQGGDVRFDDPEARLNKTFAKLFDLDTDEIDYDKPNTVTEIFENIREWNPKNKKIVNGTFTDSLAALSTDLEMENKEGDKMGQRRAKEFSEGLRKNARLIAENNYLMVCSNQIRENQDAGKWASKVKSTGGYAIGFYASLRLRFNNPKKIPKTVKIAGKEVEQIIGVTTIVEVFKSSVWKPYLTAPLTILFDYGIDDIRANLQYIKDFTRNTTFTVGGNSVGVSLEEAIHRVEEDDLVEELKNEVIDLWEEIDSKFSSNRLKKQR